MSLILPKGFAIVFDPVTHSSLFLEVDGEETHERRNLSLVFTNSHAHSGTLKVQPGPARISYENKATRRTLPGVWLHTAEMEKITSGRRPFLNATRLLSNQEFRDLYRSGTFDPEQRFKITSLTILFTDLRGSTALYDRIGDLAAFDLVRSHFGALLDAVAAEGGAVVKTIGDAVMATFPTPDRALRAAMRMREEMRKINQGRGSEDLALNIGLHSGPCLAVMLDDRQDYFGQTVNIASRVQGLAEPDAILATKPIIESSEVARLVSESSYRTTPRPSRCRCAGSAKRSKSTRFANAKPPRRHSPASFRFARKASPPPCCGEVGRGRRSPPTFGPSLRAERSNRGVASLLAMTIASERGMLQRRLNRRSALGDQLSRARKPCGPHGRESAMRSSSAATPRPPRR